MCVYTRTELNLKINKIQSMYQNMQYIINIFDLKWSVESQDDMVKGVFLKDKKSNRREM